LIWSSWWWKVRLVSCESGFQRLLLDFSADSGGNAVNKVDLGRLLVGGELGAKMLAQRVQVQRVSGQTLDERDDFLISIRQRLAHHGGLPDARKGVDDRLDLDGIDVEARTDDEILAASGNEQGTVGLDIADVSGGQPAAWQNGLGGLLRVAVVAKHHARSPDVDVAALAGGKRRSVQRSDVQFQAFDGIARAGIVARRILSRDEQRAGVFGDAVPMVKRLAEVRFNLALEGGVKRCPPGIHIAQPRGLQGLPIG